MTSKKIQGIIFGIVKNVNNMKTLQKKESTFSEIPLSKEVTLVFFGIRRKKGAFYATKFKVLFYDEEIFSGKTSDLDIAVSIVSSFLYYKKLKKETEKYFEKYRKVYVSYERKRRKYKVSGVNGTGNYRTYTFLGYFDSFEEAMKEKIRFL